MHWFWLFLGTLILMASLVTLILVSLFTMTKQNILQIHEPLEALQPKIGLVVKTRQPLDFYNWLRYYLEILGLDMIFIGIENTPHLAVSLSDWAFQMGHDPRIQILEDLEDIDNENTYEHQMIRQNSLVQKAIHEAREKKIQYLLHLDDDELLVVSKKEDYSLHQWVKTNSLRLASVADIHFNNAEAIFNTPSSQKKEICFLEEPLFYHGCWESSCRSYANGKSMGNLAFPRLSSHGPHYFQGGPQWQVPPSEIMVLHFDSCSLEKWRDKFKNLANISKDVFQRIPFSFYRESIQKVGDPSISPENLQKFYDAHVGKKHEKSFLLEERGFRL